MSMNESLNYVKALLCDCGCAWAVEDDKPTNCWHCHSSGPHTAKTTSRATPKILNLISSLTEETLFSEIERITYDGLGRIQ